MSTVELAWRARRGGGLGIEGTEGIGLDWDRVIARKDRIVASWSKGKEGSLERKGIDVLRGQARFTGPHEIRVGPRTVTAEKVVIATGSSPGRPAIPGIERGLTSDQLLARRRLPERMVVVGGGFIALEFGFAFGRAGTRVTILQAGPHVLPAVDDDIRAALVKLAPDANVELRTGARVTGIAEDGAVEAQIEGAVARFPADCVLVATGRPANTGGLDLEAAGVAVERGAVQVNEYLQSTTAAHVYAAGDVTGRHQHTPAAWYEGRLAAENALRGNRQPVDYDIFPTATFTIPAIGQVGLTEAEARRRGLRVTVSRAPFEDSSAAAVREETEGLVKVIADENSGRLVGVHILGAAAEDLIHIAAVAMRGGLTREALAPMHYVFPTLAGSVFDAMG